MKRIWPIVWKEFLHIWRDPRTLISVIIMPLFMMFLFAYALTFDVKHIPLVICDFDKSLESRALSDTFQSAKYFEVKAYVKNIQELNQRITRGQARAGLVIPRGFATKLKRGEKAGVGLAIDGSDPIIARAALNYSTSIFQIFSGKLASSFLNQRGKIAWRTSYLDARSRILYNPELTSVNFIVPGLIAIFLMTIPALIMSVAIVREKERKTFEQIIVSPVKPFELLLGKTTPYLFLAALDALLISLIGTLWFKVPFRGDLFLLIALTLLYMLATLSIGILISSLAESQQVAQTAAFLLTMLPSFVLSGFIFPISSMPKILQYISYLVPARYYLEILRGIFLKGTDFKALWLDSLMLFIFGLILVIISSLSFKKRMA